MHEYLTVYLQWNPFFFQLKQMLTAFGVSAIGAWNLFETFLYHNFHSVLHEQSTCYASILTKFAHWSVFVQIIV